MKVIKKEIKLIEFENIEGWNQQAYKINELRPIKGVNQVIYSDFCGRYYVSNITELTYIELLEYLGWGEE